MNKAQILDPFISNEPEIEVDAETSLILDERMKLADEGHLVTAEAARQHIKEWFSKSSTSKPR